MKDTVIVILSVIVCFVVIAVIVGVAINADNIAVPQKVDRTYGRAIISMPDGTIVDVENVQIKEGFHIWKIICEDGTKYIVAKENCVIFD